jgi:3-deoxy-D-manno-octulosonic acid kinase
LITRRLRDAETLGSRLRQTALPAEVWARLGQTIAAFHRHGVHHADLNVENILFGREEKIMLIDFDKGRILKPIARLSAGDNLRRLKRSLLKQASRAPVFHFSDANWDHLKRHHRRAFRNA